MHENERLSQRPFGRLTKSGKFQMDIEKVPFFNIPDLTGFNLKPYVSHATSRIDDEIFEKRKIHLTAELVEEIEEKIRNAPKAEVTMRNEEGSVASWTRKAI
jgi:hypothetical protein